MQHPLNPTGAHLSAVQSGWWGIEVPSSIPQALVGGGPRLRPPGQVPSSLGWGGQRALPLAPHQHRAARPDRPTAPSLRLGASSHFLHPAALESHAAVAPAGSHVVGPTEPAAGRRAAPQLCPHPVHGIHGAPHSPPSRLALPRPCKPRANAPPPSTQMWKGLSVATDSPSPIVVVLSGSMEPAFQRGDLLLLWNRNIWEETAVGEVVVYNVKDKDIPIVHRVVRKFGTGDKAKLLTKGDNNVADDTDLYARGQDYLERKDIIGSVYGYVPFVGGSREAGCERARVVFYERVVAYSVPGVDMDMAGASIDRQRASVQTLKTAFDTVGGTLAVCVRQHQSPGSMPISALPRESRHQQRQRDTPAGEPTATFIRRRAIPDPFRVAVRHSYELLPRALREGRCRRVGPHVASVPRHHRATGAHSQAQADDCGSADSQTRDRRREKMDWAAPGQARLGEHDGLVGWINKRSIVAQAPARPEGLQQLQASRAVPRPWEGPLEARVHQLQRLG
ncbi:hypothetical protein Purlil1_9804 [Purpureocillium lilacinum]|uniref:Signal peptidase complex catalytic subunit SEC11 n=1 Tax=Purpureocillium lilacinum TaxID=33203 RepID=A0ABR0BPD2_PURLI|nr:hypothetical protein Purlil1_9804 [Purpureocillium lilacinum]